MLLRPVVLFMALPVMTWPVTKVTSSKVEQFPKHVKSAKGDNVSMFCTFPISETVPEVFWWRRNEESFLEPDNRKRFHVQKGSGSLHIINVTVADSGMYYCKIKHQQTLIGDGSGSTLTVCVPPTDLKIVLVEGTSGNYMKFECKTTAFYPEDARISWQKDGVKIQAGTETVENKTVDGLYEATSSLEEAQPVQSGVVYSCLISHECLKAPVSVSYTFNRGEDINVPMIAGCAGGTLAMLLFIICLMTCKLKAWAGKRINSMETGQNFERLRHERTEENVAYATVNLTDDKGKSKHGLKEEHIVYYQTKQENENNKMTYANLQLAASKKASKPKQQDSSAVYAEVKVTKKART